MRARSGSAEVSRPGSGSGSGDGSAERDADEAATAQGGCRRVTLGSVPTPQLLSVVFQYRQRMGSMRRYSRTVTSPQLSMLQLAWAQQAWRALLTAEQRCCAEASTQEQCPF